MDGLVFVDADSEADYYQPSLVSYNTIKSKAITGINSDIQEEQDMDNFNYHEGKSFGEVSPSQDNSSGQKNLKRISRVIINKNSVKPHNQLFKMFEMEISRHKCHTF